MLEAAINAGIAPRCVMALGAHCDDIEIGCGATLGRLAARWPDCRIVWVTLSSDAQREAETRAAAAALLAGATDTVVRVERFRGSYFPYDGAAIKEYFETLKSFQPEIIFTHFRDDRHQDHRVVSDLTWNTFRNHLVLEYEIPKWDGDLGRPDTYVAITRAQLQRKVETLLASFPSQRDHAWFTASTFEALARLRGIECNAEEGFAEAFYARKLRLAI